MERFLPKQDVDCRRGHSPRQHADRQDGNCKGKDTRYIFKKADRGCRARAVDIARV
jgi:hypothetical protein